MSSRIGIIINSSIEEYYLQEISGGSRNFYPLKSKEDMYNKLLSNIIDASIMDAGVLEYITSAVYCNLTLVGTDFEHSAFGIVFPRNWLYEQVLDVSILSLRESGVLDTLKSKWFSSNVCSSPSDTSSELSIQQMAGIFLTFGVVSVLSLLLYTCLKLRNTRRLLLKSLKRHASSVRHSMTNFSNRLVIQPPPYNTMYV